MKKILAIGLTAMASLSMGASVEMNGAQYEVVKPQTQLLFESFTTLGSLPVVVGDEVARADVALSSPLAQPGRVTGLVIIKLEAGASAAKVAQLVGGKVVHAFDTTAMLSFADGTVLADSLQALADIASVSSVSVDINQTLIEKQ